MPPVAMLLDTLHDRTYLQVLALQLVAEEMIESKWVLGIMMIGSRHCVPLYAVFVEQFNAIHHSLPSAFSLGIEAVGIMLLLSSVDADAHKPAFVMEELAPFGCKIESIGLNAVADALAASIVLLKPNCLFVEAERFEHRLTSVPGEEHIGHLLDLDVVADVLLKNGPLHTSPRGGFYSLPLGGDGGGLQVLFLQIIAILATQVTQWSCRLSHHIKRTSVWICCCHGLGIKD